MHIISAADFPLFCSNSARKCLILPSECLPQKWLILLEILPVEFIQTWSVVIEMQERWAAVSHGVGRRCSPVKMGSLLACHADQPGQRFNAAYY